MLESSFKVNNSPAQNCMQEIVRLSAHGGNTCKMTFPGITPSPGSYYQKFLSILSSAWTAYLATQIVKKMYFVQKINTTCDTLESNKLMPVPCSAFQSVNNFDNIFYRKEKRPGCALPFWIESVTNVVTRLKRTTWNRH